MKSDTLASDKPAVESRAHTRFGDLVMLAKLRVNALVVATTAGGYYMAGPATVDLAVLSWTCFGTTLVASSAAALNQVHERDTDRLMERTRRRPVADRRMSPAEGLLFAAVLAIVGTLVLWTWSTPVAALVAVVTLATYAGMYTPLKRRTSLATVVGAVPGALPPLIGWAAVHGSVAGAAPWSLFLIGFFWQLPHVLAISWIYREEYARAGIPVLPVVDRDGSLTARQMVLWAAALVPCSLLPFLLGLATPIYAAGALVLGIGHLLAAINFLRHRSIANARLVFYGSITYLPLLWLLMVAARS